MTTKLDLFDIDQKLTVSAIKAGNCEPWQCPTEVLDLADAIEERAGQYDFKGGVCGGCWKPTIRWLTTPTGEPPEDWFQMRITLRVDDVLIDLREDFTEAVQKLRDQIEQLTDIANALESLDPAKEESEVVA